MTTGSDATERGTLDRVEAEAERRCPKARRNRKKGAKRVPHAPHIWHAGRYLPLGDLGFPVWCPGWEPTNE